MKLKVLETTLRTTEFGQMDALRTPTCIHTGRKCFQQMQLAVYSV